MGSPLLVDPIQAIIGTVFLTNGPTPASFSFIFGLFKQNKVHTVYGAGIRTHDLLNMSRHP